RCYRDWSSDVCSSDLAGLVDAEEDPINCCRRELAEETGLTARKIHLLAATFPCTGRLNNRIHSFFVEAGRRVNGFAPEAGMQVKIGRASGRERGEQAA